MDDEGPVRLFVGGLGPSVSSSDLQRTFASLGAVLSVEFIRTKGRNFAFMTFEAASQQQLKRFFSLYNGCMWKGGRLKLEKAKEHYLDKLQREWAECDLNNQNSRMCISNEGPACSPRHLKGSGESQALNIFFPRLRKVKKIPWKGSGKHKWSFVRVDATPVSMLQLCGCSQSCRGSLNEQLILTSNFFEERNKNDSMSMQHEPNFVIDKCDCQKKEMGVQGEDIACAKGNSDVDGGDSGEQEDLILNITCVNHPAMQSRRRERRDGQPKKFFRRPVKRGDEVAVLPKRIKFELNSITNSSVREEEALNEPKNNINKIQSGIEKRRVIEERELVYRNNHGNYW